MTQVRYLRRQQLADAYQGWRDGLAGVPARNPGIKLPGPVTTAHRDALIREAQDAFEAEHLKFRELVAEPHREIMASRARLDAALAALEWARLAFDMESGMLPDSEARRRRLGEERRPDEVVIQRRRREHRKILARAREAVERAEAEVKAIKEELARAEETARQHHRAAADRVVRIHHHVHRRLAVYRRSLVRSHHDGEWAHTALSPLTPHLPGWTLPDAYLPETDFCAAEAPQEQIVDPAPPQEPPSRIIELEHPVTRFGSHLPHDPDAGVGFVQLTSPLAAPWHFTIVKRGDRLDLRTKGFGHGPYLGGAAVGSAVLQPGDSFDFADRRYTMLDANRLEDTELTQCDLIAAELEAETKGVPRLTGMSFVQRRRTLLAVLGPSGAGKTSLFSALLSELPLTSGKLFFRDMDLATHASQIRERIGFVPQDTDNMHRSLSVEATLHFAFRLRSAGSKVTERAAIENALRVTSLVPWRDRLLSTLSGGQYRRVSIAMELLTDPPLLMLDEPTSGLDASMDRQIMQLLKKLSRNDRTVIIVTHATENLGIADQMLVVVEGGSPVYSGPPRYIRKSFKFSTYADLMSDLLKRPAELSARYQQGRMAGEAVRLASELAGKTSTTPARRGLVARSSALAFRTVPRQFAALVIRQCILLATRALTDNRRSRRQQLRNATVVLLPLLVAAGSAVLAAFVAGKPGLGAMPSQVGPTALTLLTTLSMLSGQALTYSDVVTELPVIRREFRAGVGAFPVIAAKWLVYAVVAVTQAAVITVVFCAIPDRAPQRGIWLGPQIDLLIDLAMLSVAAMTLGLLVSTLATKLEHAVAIVTATSIAQIALNGVTSDLSTTSVMSALAWLLPVRWGLAAAASSIDLRGFNAGHPTGISHDALWQHSTGQWLTDLVVLAVLSTCFFTLAVGRLRARLRPAKPPATGSRLLKRPG